MASTNAKYQYVGFATARLSAEQEHPKSAQIHLGRAKTPRFGRPYRRIYFEQTVAMMGQNHKGYIPAADMPTRTERRQG